jgi:peptide/nickel transport system ATP-binding protein
MRPLAEALLSVRELKKWFLQEPGFLASLFNRRGSIAVRAVDGISFSIDEGEILGIAGESGCGKTTTGMTLVKLYDPSAGEIRFRGNDIASFQGKNLKAYRRRAQIIFQNPYESLNPRMTVLDAVSEPWKIHGENDKSKREELVARALQRSGLAPPQGFFHRFPHELSGGQRQRVAIARAIVLEPNFLVADEPVSMLDVSIRAGVLKLLLDFSKKLGMAIVYISHDLSTIRQICDRLAIMYLGKIVEIGPAEEVIQNPAHPYAQALIAAVPVPDPESFRPGPQLDMEVPSALDIPPGCRFHPRCSRRKGDCSKLEPPLQEISPNHYAACFT